jgi:hypothetical protein
MQPIWFRLAVSVDDTFSWPQTLRLTNIVCSEEEHKTAKLPVPYKTQPHFRKPHVHLDCQPTDNGHYGEGWLKKYMQGS